MELIGPYKYVLENARVRPDEFALIHGPTKITFAKLHQMASSIGAKMRAAGVRKGSVVLLKVGSPIWDYLFCIAVMHEGAISAIQTSSSYNPAMAADIAFAAFDIPGFPKSKTVRIDEQWLKDAEKIDPQPPVSFSEENPIVRLVQTSGTTGDAKVLEFDIETYTSMARLYTQPQKVKYFCMLPFTIQTGAFIGYSAMAAGETYFLPTGKKVDDLQMIAAYRFSAIMASSSMVADIIADEELSTAVKELSQIAMIGSSTPRAMAQAIRLKTNAQMLNTYGSAEVGSVASKEVSLTDETNLAGHIVPTAQVRIVDSDFKELPIGQIGLIGAKTALMRTSYRNNPEATAKNFVDGYFYSGDEGYINDQGELFLVGRSDERINAGGVKSDPMTLDVAIKSVSGVQDAAVFGFDRKNGLRGLGAVLVLKKGQDIQAIVAEINENLGSKKPHAYIEVTSVPRNLMGKVLRVELEKTYTETARKLHS